MGKSDCSLKRELLKLGFLQRGVRGSDRRKCVMVTFDTDRSVTNSTQSIPASIQKLPDSVVK